MNDITHGKLHAAILQHMADEGFAPTVAELATTFDVTDTVMKSALHALQEYHGVVLHPHSSEVWVCHPFSTAPTNFALRTADNVYWGNCAWCSLGCAALLKQDVTITTTLGADGEQVELHVRDGELLEKDYVVHFPIPMTQAWDNVVYTCTTMLLFRDKADVERWSQQHRINKGDVQPIENIWEFAKVWYGNHLNPEWQKWTTQEAHDIFQRFGLTHPVWHIPTTGDRF